jgi:uncharacterized membrane protein YqaE (UPF0057 family)
VLLLGVSLGYCIFSGMRVRESDVNNIDVDNEQESIMDDLIRIVAAIFLPPLGVFLQVGFGKDFWINLLLTIFGFYILGIVHAVWVIAKK